MKKTPEEEVSRAQLNLSKREAGLDRIEKTKKGLTNFIKGSNKLGKEKLQPASTKFAQGVHTGMEIAENANSKQEKIKGQTKSGMNDLARAATFAAKVGNSTARTAVRVVKLGVQGVEQVQKVNVKISNKKLKRKKRKQNGPRP